MLQKNKKKKKEKRNLAQESTPCSYNVGVNAMTKKENTRMRFVEGLLQGRT